VKLKYGIPVSKIELLEARITPGSWCKSQEMQYCNFWCQWLLGGIAELVFHCMVQQNVTWIYENELLSVESWTLCYRW